MDRIRIEDIDVETRIGIYAAERATPQHVLVTVELLHPVAAVAEADDLRKGIDYHALTLAILELGEAERRTVERFAEDIAAMILKDFAPKRGVQVTVKKTPPLQIKNASVTIQRP